MPKINHYPNILTIRLTNAQLVAVKERADDNDLSMTEIIRDLVAKEFTKEPARV